MSTEKFQYIQWPIGIDRPTQKEYEDAEKKYRAVEIDPRDCSDWCMGLQYVMATSHISCWADFFTKLDSVVIQGPDGAWYENF